MLERASFSRRKMPCRGTQHPDWRWGHVQDSRVFLGRLPTWAPRAAEQVPLSVCTRSQSFFSSKLWVMCFWFPQKDLHLRPLTLPAEMHTEQCPGIRDFFEVCATFFHSCTWNSVKAKRLENPKPGGPRLYVHMVDFQTCTASWETCKFTQRNWL